MNTTIIEINPQDPLWPLFQETVTSLGPVEVERIGLDVEYFLSSHILVALSNDQPVGYLRFVRQQIGEDEDRPLVTFDGQVLIEAKVIAFAVLQEYRNQGIGRALQLEAIQLAKSMGCYQFRSRSNYSCEANHHLKISMGFGIQPSLENDSLYFVMKL